MGLSIRESLDIKTKVRLMLYENARVVYDSRGIAHVEGKIKAIRNMANQIVDNGHIYVANRLAGKAVSWMRYMAVGDSSGGKSSGSNALENELARVYMTEWENSGTNALIYRAILDTGVGTGALVEAGIFDEQLAGNMFCWADYAVINKNINDILEIEWTHTY